MKAWLQSILLLRDDKQQVVTNGYPYLRVDSIAGCTVKGLDMQMLLDPLEEDLNLPSFSIQLCKIDCVNQEVVSKEPIDLSISKVLIDISSRSILSVFPSYSFLTFCIRT